MVESTLSLEQFDTPQPDEPSHGGCGSCGTGSASKGLARCGNGLEKIYPTTAVRFGFIKNIGEFTHSPDMKFTCGAKVVIQTKRGIEIGDQVSLTCTGCDKSVTRDQMKEWVRRSGEDTFLFNAGRILREASAADLAEFAHIQQSAREKRDCARSAAARHKLALKVVECECLFGGERIIFFFTAAERVDFRSMVKDLATEYRTRIEMRQIGARDEARLLADFETCGREVCCKVFLKTLRPISMRMAKVQKATLDPSQVSGRCGRLKCCLRYEHPGYEEMDKRLPRVGVRIRTNHGEGVIINRQILTQIVQIRTDDNNLVAVVAEDITEVGVPPPKPREKPETTAADGSSRRRGRKGAPRSRSGSPPAAQKSKEPAAVPKADQPTAKDPPTSPTTAGPRDTSEKKTDPPRRRRRRRRRGPRGPGGAAGSGPAGRDTPPQK